MADGGWTDLYSVGLLCSFQPLSHAGPRPGNTTIAWRFAADATTARRDVPVTPAY